MGVKILVEANSRVLVELPINSFEDISTQNMSLEKSDEMIGDAIYAKYGFSADDIKVIKEIK